MHSSNKSGNNFNGTGFKLVTPKWKTKNYTNQCRMNDGQVQVRGISSAALLSSSTQHFLRSAALVEIVWIQRAVETEEQWERTFLLVLIIKFSHSGSEFTFYKMEMYEPKPSSSPPSTTHLCTCFWFLLCILFYCWVLLQFFSSSLALRICIFARWLGGKKQKMVEDEMVAARLGMTTSCWCLFFISE